MNKSRIIKVLAPNSGKDLFDYMSDMEQDIQIGDFLLVNLRGVDTVVIAWEIPEFPEKLDIILKNVKYKLPFVSLSEKHILFIKKISQYLILTPGLIFKLLLPLQIAKQFIKKIPNKIKENFVNDFSIINLSDEQQDACDMLKMNFNEHHCFLLKGITGSGKTEIYFKKMQELLASDQTAQILITLPEIYLTSQLNSRFTNIFHFEPVLWHSNLTPSQRAKNWLAINDGTARVVIGARSAIFLPFKHLALIIVDEEHDGSYKQDEGIMYHGRSAAIMRGFYENFPVILSSATPSFETLYNTHTGKYTLANIGKRYGNAVLPNISIVDLKGKKKDTYLSAPVIEHIKKTYEAGYQSLLYLNRRGYSPLTLCNICSHKISCKYCSSWMVMHLKRKRMICHECNYTTPIFTHCPTCRAEDSLVGCGPGVEKIAEEVGNLFPNLRKIIITSDEMQNIHVARKILDEILEERIDIIIGTQMIAKGYHFPKLKFVGVIDADIGLSGGDMRASEKTLQLLTQVSGRAGREGEQGEVVLQTYYPDSQVIKAIENNDIDEFIRLELMTREMVGFPPFSRLIAVIIMGKKEQEVQNYAEKTAYHLGEYIKQTYSKVNIYGPAPALIFQIRGNFRFRILLSMPKNILVQKILAAYFSKFKTPYSITVRIDIDPINFM